MSLAARELWLHDALVALAQIRVDEADVCRALGPRIRLFAQRRLAAADAVEDFVQETLLAVLQARREGRVVDADLTAFALTTCRGRILDTHRTHQRRAALLDALPEAAGNAGLMTELVVLGQLLPQLETRLRRVLLETFMEGRQSAEIAERMGLTEANVRVLRHRALVALRERLGGEP
jgi:RNA polymerase sigma-70 factor (ECF subfamily)